MMNRAASRIQLAHGIAIREGNQRIVHTTIDISMTGLGVLGPMLPSPGKLLRVEWPLEAEPPAFADAMVVRIEPAARGQHVLGLKFQRVDPRLQHELSRRILARPRVRVCRSGFMKRVSHAPEVPRPSAADLPAAIEAVIPRNQLELEKLYRLAVSEVEQFAGRPNRKESCA